MTQTYKHKDYYLCAYLILNGCPLKDQYRLNGATVFTFERTDKLREHVAEFFSKNSNVDAYEYSKTVRNLKNIIHLNRTTAYNTVLTPNHGERTNVKQTEGTIL